MIFSFSKSARNPSYNFEKIGVSIIGQTPSKPGFLFFFFNRVMKPCFQIVGICPDLVISLNRTDKGLDRKSPKALIRGNGISKGQTLVFLSLSILLSISDGETVREKGDGASVDNWIGNARRL